MLRKKTILRLTCAGYLFFGVVCVASEAGAQQSNVAGEPSASQPAPDLPDSPSALVYKTAGGQSPADLRQQFDEQIALARSPMQTQTGSTQVPAQPQSAAPASVQKPAGTAVAESPMASGIAASQPAGVAIAPAKQHRVRTIVLRTGAIIGAGVAVGTVVALTAGTSSKPPGAH
jgi:hypothetical protein